jgi:predicted metal-dependent enzyme (double-stranded beta helix superfamily)
MNAAITIPEPLAAFVHGLDAVLESEADEAAILRQGRALLAGLIAQDGWLPAALLEPDPDSYRIHRLYVDPAGRFSVSAMVWGPGQGTPIHDHTVWGMVGVLRGAERCEEFEAPAAPGALRQAGEHLLPAGAIDLVSPRVGDIHRVSNALPDAVSVSIHVYGANIGALARHVYDPESGERRRFVSGYANEYLPNLWSVTCE